MYAIRSYYASAQNSESYNKGKKVIGADFSGSYSNDGNYEFLTASTTPEFGYFIHNNLALGVTMNLEYLYQMGYTRVNGLHRITSYNVCYTKLLRDVRHHFPILNGYDATGFVYHTGIVGRKNERHIFSYNFV